MKRVVYVSAEWCSPCKVFKPVLHKVTTEMKIPVEYVNVDYDAKYVSEFGIQAVPTTLCFSDNSLIWKQSGVIPESVLKSKLSF